MIEPTGPSQELTIFDDYPITSVHRSGKAWPENHRSKVQVSYSSLCNARDLFIQKSENLLIAIRNYPYQLCLRLSNFDYLFKVAITVLLIGVQVQSTMTQSW
jgi:hypothetical protein